MWCLSLTQRKDRGMRPRGRIMKWPAGTNATVRKIENAGKKMPVEEAMHGPMVIDDVMTVIRIGSWRKVETNSSLGVPPFIFVFLLRGFVDLHIGPSPGFFTWYTSSSSYFSFFFASFYPLRAGACTNHRGISKFDDVPRPLPLMTM